MAAIEATDIHKRFGPLAVLQGLTLRVERGEVYGLLGPNGAGKSTLIHLLLGCLRPDHGRLTLLDTAPTAARSRLGYLPERLNYYAYCTAREYLADMGAFSGLRGPALAERCRVLLQQVGLTAAVDRRIGGFSKGMLQRLGIAQAFSRNVDLFGHTAASVALRPVQALLGIPLLPALSGFALSAEGSYGIAAAGVLLGQSASIGVLLALALLAFDRRELILAS
jgi:ABC-type uncharacterized transport system ATPase subunit